MTLTRRSFLHASLMAGGLVLVPKFGRVFPVRRIVELRPPSTQPILDGQMSIEQWNRMFWREALEAIRRHPRLVISDLT